MGQYSEVSICALFKTQKGAKKAKQQVEKFDEYLKEKLADKEFYTEIGSIKLKNKMVMVELSSGREQNATWQAEQMFNMIKETSKEELEEFSAEQVVPENIIWYNAEDARINENEG
jgi:hypothetical protein